MRIHMGFTGGSIVTSLQMGIVLTIVKGLRYIKGNNLGFTVKLKQFVPGFCDKAKKIDWKHFIAKALL